MTAGMTLNDGERKSKPLSGHFPPPAIVIITRESPASAARTDLKKRERERKKKTGTGTFVGESIKLRRASAVVRMKRD